MKIKYLSLAMALGLCSCGDSDTNGPTVCPVTQSFYQTLLFDVNSSGDKGSRGGRVLTSSEAANDIDVVCVAVYRLEADGSIGEKVFSRDLSWKDSIASLQEGQMVHINFRGAPELASTHGLDDGFYTVMATGYSFDHSFVFRPAVDALDAASPFANAVCADGQGIEEIFAGGIPSIEVKDRQFVPDASSSAFKTVTLRRQVAGTFGYFSNIPSKGFDGTPATHLRLVASNENNLLRLAAFNETGAVESVVNGAKSGTLTPDAKFADGADGYTVYETALTDWFPNGDVTGDGVLNDKDANYNGMSGNWKVPAWLDNKLSVKVGTIFCSNFLVPFLCDSRPTFELQLVAKIATGGIVVLRHWGATVADRQTGVKVVGENGKLADTGNGESVSSYSILRNHIYSMGKKSLAKPDPDSPSDGDEPENLSKGEIVVMTVNDNWEEHNRLIIKPQV